MRQRLAFLFCALSLMADAQNPQAVNGQTLVYVDDFPASNFQFQTWLNIIQPVRMAVTTPASPLPATINIAPSSIGCGTSNMYCSTPGTIYAPTTPVADNETWTDVDYLGFTHEVGHQSLPPETLNGFDTGFVEGLASGKKGLIYATLHGQNPSLFPANSGQPNMTCAPSVDMWNNRKMRTYGGATNADGSSNFYGNRDNNFDSPCALITHLMEKLGGDFRQFDAAVNANIPKTRSDFLAIADSFNVMIDGVKPSTFLQYDVTNFAGGKDGAYFGIRSFGGLNGKYQPAAGNVIAFNPTGYNQTLAVFKNGMPTATNGTFTWSLIDTKGTQLATQTGSIKNPIAASFGWNPTLDPKQTGAWYANYPTGAYKITACLSDQTGTCTNPNDPNMNDSDVFPVANEDLDPGDVAVIANGDRWGDLPQNQVLTLVSPNASSVTIEQYPGLYIFRHIPRTADGGFEDITVTDGVQTRTFTPDRWAPMARTFHRRDEPILNAITRATDYKVTANVTPGALYTLWGWNFTSNDPAMASSFPIPTNGLPGTAMNDQGRTVVTFTTASGAQFNAPILYLGFTQINFAAPNELAMHLGETVTAVVSVNGTPSETLNLTVAAQDPGAFILNFAAHTAAAAFAAGTNTGTLVSNQHPATSGSILSVFGTGLGPKMMTGMDGEPMTGANATQAIVNATIGGKPANVLYSGCAPGFVGLDQINLIVPDNVPAGMLPVVLIVNGVSSSPAMLAVGK
jgi:uncharacterized protein (TIGR03437 family)